MKNKIKLKKVRIKISCVYQTISKNINYDNSFNNQLWMASHYFWVLIIRIMKDNLKKVNYLELQYRYIYFEEFDHES